MYNLLYLFFRCNWNLSRSLTPPTAAMPLATYLLHRKCYCHGALQIYFPLVAETCHCGTINDAVVITPRNLHNIGLLYLIAIAHKSRETLDLANSTDCHLRRSNDGAHVSSTDGSDITCTKAEGHADGARFELIVNVSRGNLPELHIGFLVHKTPSIDRQKVKVENSIYFALLCISLCIRS